MSKPLFDVVCIAKNESKTLPRLVASLKEFQERGGKIFICDTGSTDGTHDIARGLGCEVTEVGDRFRIHITDEQVEQINAPIIANGEAPIVEKGDSIFDFTSARNFAATLADQDMVAMPDCDEIYTKLDIDKINEHIRNGAQQFEYNFVFAHDQFGNETVKFRHSKFYNKNVLSWRGRIHEVLHGDAQRVYLDESVCKLEHWQNHETPRIGYMKGLALDTLLDPENDRHAFYFARDLMYHGRDKSAIAQFKRHIAMGKWPAERAQSMVFVGDLTMKQGNVEEALDWWWKAWNIEPNRRIAMLRLARYYDSKEDRMKVACLTSAALQIPESGFYGEDMNEYRDDPHHLRAWSYKYLGREQDAQDEFLKAFAYKPHDELYQRNAVHFGGLAECLVKLGVTLPKVSILIPHLENAEDTIRQEGLQKCLDSIDRLNYQKDLIEVIVNNDKEPTVPQKVKTMWEQCTGDVAIYAANDTEFTPDCVITAVLESKDHGLVALNTGPLTHDSGNANEHFLIRRDLVERLKDKEIFHTSFFHVGCDNYLTAQTKKLGEFYRSEKAVMIHNHFTRGAKMDDVYMKAWNEERVAKDRENLKRLLEELENQP